MSVKNVISHVLNVIFKFCLRVMKGIAMLYNILVGFLVTLHWFRDTRSQTFTKKKKDFLHIFKIHVPSWYFEEGCITSVRELLKQQNFVHLESIL